ncbi:MAG: hypothetical protein Q9167_000819 [Letrouitia subvulpina]
MLTLSHTGIGNAFVRKYLSRPNTTVFACVRASPGPGDSSPAALLHQIPIAEGSKLHVLEIESRSENQARKAIASISSLSPSPSSFSSITHLDIVIANAGIYPATAFSTVADMDPADLLAHVDVNAVGMVRIFQAALPLLKRSKKNPRFMAVSSSVGSIAGMDAIAPFPLGSYGASKAALNFLVRRIHFENEDLVAFAAHPGYVLRCGVAP